MSQLEHNLKLIYILKVEMFTVRRKSDESQSEVELTAPHNMDEGDDGANLVAGGLVDVEGADGLSDDVAEVHSLEFNHQ